MERFLSTYQLLQHTFPSFVSPDRIVSRRLASSFFFFPLNTIFSLTEHPEATLFLGSIGRYRVAVVKVIGYSVCIHG